MLKLLRYAHRLQAVPPKMEPDQSSGQVSSCWESVRVVPGGELRAAPQNRQQSDFNGRASGPRPAQQPLQQPSGTMPALPPQLRPKGAHSEPALRPLPQRRPVQTRLVGKEAVNG
jgi:hypothetical protein